MKQSSWDKVKPKSRSERNILLKKYGKKCFLGPELSFPICNKNTGKINKEGVKAAYNLSKIWGKPKSSYKNKRGKPKHKREVYLNIQKKARKILGYSNKPKSKPRKSKPRKSKPRKSKPRKSKPRKSKPRKSNK